MRAALAVDKKRNWIRDAREKWRKMQPRELLEFYCERFIFAQTASGLIDAACIPYQPVPLSPPVAFPSECPYIDNKKNR
jgi:hypothetical protein